MKRLVIGFLVFSFIRPTDHEILAVVVMVKDEGTTIVETLNPYVQAGVRNFLVFDTGSTDDTQSVVRNFFQQQPIVNGYLEEEPFIDFAISRNKALTRAKMLFPQATFLLMPDAEWYFNNVNGLLQFCEIQKNSPEVCFLTRIECWDEGDVHVPTLDYYVSRLIRAESSVEFEGKESLHLCAKGG